MLYSVIIVNKKARMVYHKELVALKDFKPSIISNIVFSMSEKYKTFIGSPCIYLEFDNICLALVKNKKYLSLKIVFYANFYWQTSF